MWSAQGRGDGHVLCVARRDRKRVYALVETKEAEGPRCPGDAPGGRRRVISLWPLQENVPIQFQVVVSPQMAGACSSERLNKA